MALPGARLSEITAVAATTGNDPALDSLLIRLHAETACRRGGALSITPQDLDPQQCLIRLREKGRTERRQPVSPTLMTHLRSHAQTRGGPDSRERLLRYATGKPITARRYDYLWDRLGEHLPWVRTQQVTTHWIRHTILTWVEMGRVASEAASAPPSRKPTPASTTPAGAHAPCCRVGAAVAGDELDDLCGLLPVPGDGAAQLRDLGGAGEPVQAGARATLIVLLHDLPGSPGPINEIEESVPERARSALIHDGIARGWLRHLHHDQRTPRAEGLARELRSFHRELRQLRPPGPRAAAWH